MFLALLMPLVYNPFSVGLEKTFFLDLSQPRPRSWGQKDDMPEIYFAMEVVRIGTNSAIAFGGRKSAAKILNPDMLKFDLDEVDGTGSWTVLPGVSLSSEVALLSALMYKKLMEIIL